MNIEKLPSGSYRIRQMYKGKTYKFTLDHKPTKKEAMLLVSEMLQDSTNVQSGTFEKYAKDYVENRRSVLSPSSIRTYEIMIKMISESFNSTNLYDIDQELVQKEINKYAEDHSPKSVRSLHGFISTVLRVNRPSLKLSTTLPQKEVKKRYLPTQDDIKAILEAAKGTEDSVGFQLGILGLRRGEVCALTIEDLNGHELSITKNLVYYDKKWIVKSMPKTEASYRTIMLPDSLAEEIQKQGYIFKYSPKKLNKHLQEYQDRLNIPRFRFHDLRHYFASYAHSLGICDADIMAMGGWETDFVMKRVYREAMEDSRKESALKIANSILA